jgi:tetratricopeptide (TPR) repeat protein
MSPMRDDRRSDYTPAFDRAEEGVRQRFAHHVEELDVAVSLAVDLLAAPEASRGELLRQPRFHALGLCELLLERCREAWMEEPARAVELASLAVEVAARLDATHYGAGLVEDARARLWAHLANACRIGSDLRRAEEALAAAWEHHRRAGEDAFTEAEILSFEGSLRNSQGRFEEAVHLFDRALAIYREGRDRHREGRTLIKKGMARGDGGRLKDAIRLLRRGLAAIDAALVSLDLAMVHARRGDTGEVQRLAAEMLPIFESRDVRSEALAALVLLRGAVETERVSLEVLEHLAGQLRRA